MQNNLKFSANFKRIKLCHQCSSIFRLRNSEMTAKVMFSLVVASLQHETRMKIDPWGFPSGTETMAESSECKSRVCWGRYYSSFTRQSSIIKLWPSRTLYQYVWCGHRLCGRCIGLEKVLKVVIYCIAGDEESGDCFMGGLVIRSLSGT